MDGLSCLTSNRDLFVRIAFTTFLIAYGLLSTLGTSSNVEPGNLLWQSKNKSLIHSEVLPQVISPFDQHINLKLISNKALELFEVSYDGGLSWVRVPVLPKTKTTYFMRIDIYSPRTGSLIGFQQGYNSRNQIRGIFVRAMETENQKWTQPLTVALFYDLIRPERQKGSPSGDPLKISDNREIDYYSTF